MAAMADAGIDIVVALLGTNNVLLDQNTVRLSETIGIASRTDYRWVEFKNPSLRQEGRHIEEALSRGRVVFIPLLKHSKRIASLTSIIEQHGLGSRRILILDDEADQASPNTQVKRGEQSAVHAALEKLRRAAEHHYYVQFTATPYGLFLIDPQDHLFPDFVELLAPGDGYTGGKEFFVDNYERVVRTIPSGDEQGSALPFAVSSSLQAALAAFFIGASILLRDGLEDAPISMLIHPSHKTEVHERYRYLVARHVSDLQDFIESVSDWRAMPGIFHRERQLLEARVGQMWPDSQYLAGLRMVIRQAKISLLNSQTAVRRIDWNESPIHILIGGNKLDRGLTVEGLTVSYMNRPASEQVDTLEQRARAFGYRSRFLPFCQFFASAQTIITLRDIVLTEDDLRKELSDAIARGETVREWSRSVGMLIPSDTIPTREAIVRALTSEQLGWHHARKPSFETETLTHNRKLVEALQLNRASLVNYGRLEFRTVDLSAKTALETLIRRWRVDQYSPNWYPDQLVRVFERSLSAIRGVQVVLLERDEGGNRLPRRRAWTPEGFVNIFQGRDTDFQSVARDYPGDRAIGERQFAQGIVMIQIHRIVRDGDPNDVEVLVPAIFLGNRQIVRSDHG
jgi:hypothetical protein